MSNVFVLVFTAINDIQYQPDIYEIIEGLAPCLLLSLESDLRFLCAEYPYAILAGSFKFTR